MSSAAIGAVRWLVIVVVVYTAVTLLVLVPLHVGAALKHHFWDHHDVLEGMLPDIPDAEEPRARSTHKRQAPRSRPA